MYRRSKFVEVLHEIRREMSTEADLDVDIFVEMVRSGNRSIREADLKPLTGDSSSTAETIAPLVVRSDD